MAPIDGSVVQARRTSRLEAASSSHRTTLWAEVRVASASVIWRRSRLRSRPCESERLTWARAWSHWSPEAVARCCAAASRTV
jgi:hypothetical protein